MNTASKKLHDTLPDSQQKAPLALIIEIVIGAFLSLTSFLGFIYITEDILEKDGIFIDTAISKYVYEFRDPILTSIMHAVSFLGGEFTLFMSFAITGILIIKKYKREAIFLFLTISGGYVINLSLKYLLKIPRPTIDPIYIEKFYSFPSGHAMNAFIFYAALAYLTYHFTKNRTLSIFSTVIAGTLIFLIGFSRIYLGVHYPSDVIAGFIAGFWWVVTTIVLDKTLVFYKLIKKKK